MLDLAHEALLTFSENNRCDTEHPVIMDQVFGAEMKRLETRRSINKLKTKIKRLKKKVHSVSGIEMIDIDLDNVYKIHDMISRELFDHFTWERVTTNIQASWKEYFHLLYDLIVVDYTSDHAGNVLLARAVTRYHDVFVEPEKVEPVDKLYSVISSLRSLFDILKNEQVKVCTGLKGMKHTLREFQSKMTSIQHIILSLENELAMEEEDEQKYLKIVKWSTV